MQRLLISIPFLFVLIACEAKPPVEIEAASASTITSSSKPVQSTLKPSTRDELMERARKRHGREPTMGDLFDELMHEAKHAVGGIKEPGQPRVVKKGAQPEIIISAETVNYNGKLLKFGVKLKEWESVLGRATRRYDSKLTTLLVWDELGFDVLENKISKATQFTIYMNKLPPDPYAEMVTHRPDGTPVEASIDHSPKKAFSGYLEMDSFGIDAQTKFWEIVKTANPNRNIHCPLRDCSHPAGSMGDNSGSIYFILNRGDENGNILDLSITGKR